MARQIERHDLGIDWVFCDVKDTLGVVDRPGHLLTYKPSTIRLLKTLRHEIGVKIGIITNLPKSLTAAQGRAMLDEAGITDLVDVEGIVINHEAGNSKPGPDIYRYAANLVDAEIGRCLFLGENLIEVLGAQAAGMRAVVKPCPPGREFKLQATHHAEESATFSGRLSEMLLEEDHLIGNRIVGCAIKIVELIKAGGDLPLAAMGTLCFLTKNYVDPFHHKKEEEALIKIAIARGFPAEECGWVAREHDQGRAYFDGMEIALARIRAGDAAASRDFRYCAEGFTELYKAHGKKEDDEFFPKLGKFLDVTDDSLVVELMARIGPGDPSPWLNLISGMEIGLGIVPG